MPVSDRIQNRFIEIPVEVLSEPTNGYRAIVASWWPTLNGKAVGYKCTASYWAPQCNQNQEIAKSVADKLGFGEPVFVPLAFWPLDGAFESFRKRIIAATNGSSDNGAGVFYVDSKGRDQWTIPHSQRR